jgi:hypothetical protein
MSHGKRVPTVDRVLIMRPTIIAVRGPDVEARNHRTGQAASGIGGLHR